MTDPTAITDWLTLLHGEQPAGLIHVCATGNWTGNTFTNPTDAAAYAAQLDHAGPEGVYARATTLTAPLTAGQRGGEADTHALPGLWADLDIAGPGHKTTQPLPPDEDAAKSIITETGLVAPTLWIHSGGGLYPWWLLDTPHQVNGDLDDLKALSNQWQRVIADAAQRLGLHYGTGVGDLARVLRVPGTTNRKAGLRRPCRIIQDGTGERFTLDQLRDTLAASLTAHPTPEPTRPAITAVPAPGTGTSGLSPGDDYENHVDWAQILTGWTLVSERGGTRYWRRPDKTDGISATTGRNGDRDRLFVFTTSTELDAWTPYTKFGAYAKLCHAGDHKAAARELAHQGYGRPTPLSGDQHTQDDAELYQLAGHTPPTGPRTLTVVDGNTARVIAEPAPHPTAYGPTEDGLARALVAAHGHHLRYCPQRASWLTWAGHRWEWDHAETHREHIRELARELPDDQAWRTFKRRAMTAGGVTGTARLAQTDRAVVVHIDRLDAHPYQLNTPTGIVDLRTGRTRPPDPSALHTRSTAVAPDDRASEVFNQFLDDTFAGNTTMSHYVGRLFGISAIGTVLEQVMPFCYGAGANGKSTLIEAVMRALGTGETGYAMAAPADMLMARRHTEHPVELAQLAGARLVACTELEDGARFAEARIKQLTGRDSINARFMRANPFTFTPSHTLWLLGNSSPAVKSGGPAFWRRIRRIAFTQVVPPEQRDPELGDKLTAEAGSILTWLIRGAADYHTNGGLRDPDSVIADTKAYEAEQDTIAGFIDERCHITSSAARDHVRTSTSDVRAAYEEWCKENGVEPATHTRFGTDLRDRWGVDKTRSHGRKFYAGLSLLTDADSDDGGA